VLFLNPNCIYEVKTHWGYFKLCERAYEDYLKGILWITWINDTVTFALLQNERGDKILVWMR